jgi:hypothetical protein
MKAWRNIVTILLLDSAIGVAPGVAGEVVPAPVPFGVGERLTFHIRYGFLPAGVATMEVREIVDCGGGRCYHIISEARSTKPFSLFFEVTDLVSSYMDVERLHTCRYEKNLREGNYTRQEVVVFDQVNHTATYPDSAVVAIPPGVQDVLSSLYYLRTKEIRVGETVVIENHGDKKNYPLEVRILRTESVSVPAGEFECFVVEPIIKASGLFQHQGRLTVWLTNDSRRMPVMMKGKIIVGSISAVLSEVRPGG